MCEICSKLTKKTLERRQWRRSGVFVFNFEQIWHCSSVSIVEFEQVMSAVVLKFDLFQVSSPLHSNDF